MRFCIAASVFFTTICLAQSPAPEPKFEVATIKLSDCVGGVPSSPGRLNRKCAHLRDLIQVAYGHYRINPFADQVLGGPGWLDSDFYDIIAKADGTATMAQMNGPMMRALLEDRFKLKIHRVPKEVPVYELTVGKDGPKLQATKDGSCMTPDADGPPRPPTPEQLLLRECGERYMTGHGGDFDMYGATMANLCNALSFMMDRDVVDKTGIQGKFDIHLQIAPNTDAAAASPAGGITGAPPPPDPRSMIADILGDVQKMYEGVLGPALQQQLGLKIQSGTGRGETLVIDHIERPTGN